MEANDFPAVPQLVEALRGSVEAFLQGRRDFCDLPENGGGFVVLGRTCLYGQEDLLCLKRDATASYFTFTPSTGQLKEHVIAGGLRPGELNTLSAALLVASRG